MAGIPHTTIMGLSQQQMSQAASMQSYGNFLSDQYGTRKTPSSQASISGAAPGYDPRFSNALAFQGAQMMPGMAQGAIGAAALAGGFGFGPRFMDPFSTVLGAARHGFGQAGIAGAAGYGLGAALPYYAAGKMFNWGSEQVMQGVQQQQNLGNMIGSTWNRSTMPMMAAPGVGGQQQLGNMISGMAAQSPYEGFGDIAGILGAGLQGGSFKGAGNMQQFAQTFRTLVNEVRQVATTFNTSLQDAYSVSQQIKGMGFYGAGGAGQVAATVRGLSSAVGMSNESLMNSMSGGADMWSQAGLSRSHGATAMADLTTQIAAGANSGLLNSNRIRDMFGGVGMDQAAPQLAQRLMGYGMRFSGTRLGQRALGAALDPETGAIDPTKAARLSMMSYSEVGQAYNENMRSPGARQLLRARSTELAGQMNEQLGPGWWASQVRGKVSARGGGRPETEELLTQMFGHIPTQEMDILNSLSEFGPELQGQIKMRGRLALQKGMDDARGARAGSIYAIKARMREAFVGPIERKLEDFGRNVLGKMQDWTADAVESLVGGGQGVAPVAQGVMNAYQTGAAGGLYGGLPAAPPGFGAAPYSAFSSPGGMIGSAIDTYAGSGFGRVMRGGEFGGVTGFATSQWNPGTTAAAASLMPIIGGRSAAYGAGYGATALGGAMMRRGGLGMVAGGALSGAGWLARGASTALRGAAPYLMAGDLAFNVMPNLMRNAPYTGDVLGAEPEVVGAPARLLEGFRQGSRGGAMTQAFSHAGMGSYDPANKGSYIGVETSYGRQNWLDSLGDLMPGARHTSGGGYQIGFSSRETANQAVNDVTRGLLEPMSTMEDDLSTAEANAIRGMVGGMRSSGRYGGLRPGEYETRMTEDLLENMRESGYGRAADAFTKRGLGGMAALMGVGGYATDVTLRDARSINRKYRDSRQARRHGLLIAAGVAEEDMGNFMDEEGFINIQDVRSAEDGKMSFGTLAGDVATRGWNVGVDYLQKKFSGTGIEGYIGGLKGEESGGPAAYARTALPAGIGEDDMEDMERIASTGNLPGVYTSKTAMHLAGEKAGTPRWYALAEQMQNEVLGAESADAPDFVKKMFSGGAASGAARFVESQKWMLAPVRQRLETALAPVKEEAYRWANNAGLTNQFGAVGGGQGARLSDDIKKSVGWWLMSQTQRREHILGDEGGTGLIDRLSSIPLPELQDIGAMRGPEGTEAFFGMTRRVATLRGRWGRATGAEDGDFANFTSGGGTLSSKDNLSLSREMFGGAEGYQRFEKRFGKQIKEGKVDHYMTSKLKQMLNSMNYEDSSANSFVAEYYKAMQDGEVSGDEGQMLMEKYAAMTQKPGGTGKGSGGGPDMEEFTKGVEGATAALKIMANMKSER